MRKPIDSMKESRRNDPADRSSWALINRSMLPVKLVSAVLVQFVVLVIGSSVLAGEASAIPSIGRVGTGSYARVAPTGARRPPETIYAVDTLCPPFPTNQWWSSVLWTPLSDAHYPHPLAVRAERTGLRVFYPGPQIIVTSRSILASMPGGSEDLTIGHSHIRSFDEARVETYSDWFVTVRFGDFKTGMSLTYGHGSPFVYAQYRGGTARIVFARKPEIWAGSPAEHAVAITVNGKHYALFGPRGSKWIAVDDSTWVNLASESPVFSLALLPEKSEKAFALFSRYAHSRVIGTEVRWQYDPATSSVVTTFNYKTVEYEGSSPGTLFALYPHQWKNTDVKILPYEYASVRGTMKLAEGQSFTTRMTFPGVLPVLPATPSWNRTIVDRYLEEDCTKTRGTTGDTYWEGKWLGRQATLAALATENGNRAVQQKVLRQIQQRLEDWFTAAEEGGRLKSSRLFYYDGRWGTLIGYPAAYGSDTELNDHHFHYGYFLRAAAEIVRYDPSWADASRWGGLLQMMIDDIACRRRGDSHFPFLRCFDVYAGHSWASGHARFADGNNQESSSEAMNAWCALILLGEATYDTALRDLGVYLYTSELYAINEYWFDVSSENRPRSFDKPVVGIIWGGKADYATWFSPRPEAIHGINWLPFHGGALYLGLYPEYVHRNYEALVAHKGGPNWDQWADLIWMYRALDDPQDALRQFSAAAGGFQPESGNSKTNTYCWIHSLLDMGRVDRSVTADHPLYAVFRRGEHRTYVAFNLRTVPVTVHFSDGTQITVPPGSRIAIQRVTKRSP
ncbi:glycosyl hydrolase [Thermogutta sp.]|uniref:glycosyl hydrolase n=1 Tax=Thermogutta sp. TaxID=1962930 RepID=UPI003C7D490A